ncbi:MAG: helix-turn-helix transcriptional regulator, partial [Myxococcales bacterium]|nr:helix-turn-helix transcriptional regulator [Myxococcales bacterium]
GRPSPARGMEPSTTIAHNDRMRGSMEAALEQLRVETRSSVVAFLPITQRVDARFHYGELRCAADGVTRRGIHASAVGKPIPTDWDPELPVLGDVNRVVLAAQRIHAEGGRLESRQAYKAIYAPLGLRDTLRALVYDGPRCVGWFGALRAGDAGSFSANDLVAMERGRDALTTHLIAESRRDVGIFDGCPAHILCSDQGAILGACTGARAWLDAERAARIREVVRHAVRAAPEPVYVVGHVAFHVTRLHHEDSRVVYLNAPLGTFASVHASTALTRRQREVAELASLGLTAAEIAEELHLSVHTAKQHLRAVYLVLGVHRREQLVAVLDPGSRG